MFDDFLDALGFDFEDDDFPIDEPDEPIDIIISDMEGIDLDGDGIADVYMQEIDTDGNGITDAVQYVSFEDTDGNGVFDTVITETDIDANEDGIIDSVITETGFDADENGYLDALQIDSVSDLDDDGQADYISTQYFEDTDGNGEFDYVMTGEDFDGDTIFDNVSEMQDFDNDGIFEDLVQSGEASNYDTFDPDESNPDMVIGDPAGDAESWHVQETGSTCAVASQEFVLEQLTGQEFNESDLAEIAEQYGWYVSEGDNAGTPPDCVGNLLELMGIDVEKSYNNSISDIEDCLNNGGKVIVGLDSSEVWDGEDDDFSCGMRADHAVQVTGIDYTDADNPMVILNDSGVANGSAACVPLDDFVDAWEDGGFFMVEAYADDSM